MDYSQIAGIGAIGSTMTSLTGTYLQGIQNDITGYNADIERYRAKTNMAMAKTQGKQTALALTMNYNKAMASNVVMSAAQGRRGGSAIQIAEASEEQYNWDLDFAEMSSKIQEGGYQSYIDSKQYIPSMGQTMMGGLGKAMGSGQKYYQNMSLIGGIK